VLAYVKELAFVDLGERAEGGAGDALAFDGYELEELALSTCARVEQGAHEAIDVPVRARDACVDLTARLRGKEISNHPT
jgi:hypothetical protein